MNRFPSPPLIFRPDGTTAWIANLYRGQSAFLICAGPSLRDMDLSPLLQRGILTCAVNNAGTLLRSQLWVGVDHPASFCDVIWRDPGTMKFVPRSRLKSRFRERDSADQLVDSAETVAEMPGVYGIELGGQFAAERFLHETCFTWGNLPGNRDDDSNLGARSVFLVALKLLYVLGIRRVFLLGCDFRMRYGQANYAFQQDRTRASVRNNNRTYRILQTRLTHLQPYFQEADFHIVNCTPNSGLRVFPSMPLSEAIKTCLENMPQNVVTEGMYEPKQQTDSDSSASR